MTYHLAKLHPNLVDDRDPRHQGLLLTRAEKERVIQDFYAHQQHIPLCFDHCGATQGGFVVPQKDRIGRVLDLFNDRHGQMLVKFQLDGEHPTFSPLMRGLHQEGERWGVSVWIDVARAGGPQGPITQKQLTHVALTQDPYFANHNTFLRDWSPTPTGIDKLVVEKGLYQAGVGECHAGEPFLAKLKGVCILNTPFASPYSRYLAVSAKKARKTMDVEQKEPAVPENDGDEVLKKQRLANDASTGLQRANAQPVVQVPTFDDVDMEHAGDVNRGFKQMTEFMQQHPNVASGSDAFMDRYAEMRMQKKKHDGVFVAQLQNMREHGFDTARVEQMKPETMDTFYDYVACSQKAMTLKDTEIQRLRDENTKLQSHGPVTYTTKSTKTTTTAQAPLTNERREQLRGTYYDSLFSELKKPNAYTKQPDPHFAATHQNELSMAQSMIQSKMTTPKKQTK